MGTVGKGGRAGSSLEPWPRVRTSCRPNRTDVQSYGRMRMWPGWRWSRAAFSPPAGLRGMHGGAPVGF